MAQDRKTVRPWENTEADAKNAHPTLIPAYDVETYAKKADDAPAEPMRETVSTLTDEIELESARIASMQTTSQPPPTLDDGPPTQPEPDVDEDPLLTLRSLSAVPRLLITPDDLYELRLDHHMAFILTLIDGVLDFETIIDVCGMQKAESLKVLVQLTKRRVIGARLPR